MAEAIPYWVGKYVGIQFKDRGRDITGCDCWGLSRIVLYNEFGLNFPSLLDGYVEAKDKEAVEKIYKQERESEEWVPVKHGKEQLGDIIVFRIRGIPCHVGLVITPGFMLHIERGANSCFVPYNNLKWKDRIDGFYRPRMLAVHGPTF